MKRPYLHFYTADFLSSKAVSTMTAAQVGGYILLLCHAWSEDDCGLPDDDEELALLSKLGPDWATAGARIRKQFHADHERPGRLFNARLEKELAECRERSEKAQASARDRWDKRKPNESTNDATAMRTQCAKKRDSGESGASGAKVQNHTSGNNQSLTGPVSYTPLAQQSGCERIPTAMRPHTDRNANAMPTVCSSDSDSYPEEIQNPPPTPAPAGDAPSARSDRPDKPEKSALPEPKEPEDFAQFWAAYPVKKARPAALKAWLSRLKAGTLPPLEGLLAAVATQRTWRAWIEGFAPHPATWINGERWADEPEPERANGRASTGSNGNGSGRRGPDPNDGILRSETPLPDAPSDRGEPGEFEPEPEDQAHGFAIEPPWPDECPDRSRALFDALELRRGKIGKALPDEVFVSKAGRVSFGFYAAAGAKAMHGKLEYGRMDSTAIAPLLDAYADAGVPLPPGNILPRPEIWVDPGLG